MVTKLPLLQRNLKEDAELHQRAISLHTAQDMIFVKDATIVANNSLGSWKFFLIVAWTASGEFRASMSCGRTQDRNGRRHVL